MNEFQAFLSICALLYFLGVIFYLTMCSLNEALKVAGKNTYSFVIYEGDTRTDKEKTKSEIIYIFFYFLLKILGFFWTLIWYSMKHIFVFVMLFAIALFIFIVLPSNIIPQQYLMEYLINVYTLSILTIVNTTLLLLHSRAENDYSQKLND
ncbi:hypothetical protein [Tychonema sp. BBK16]|uniref:hypothetical protein n=1 Tax=Tychonema sp. BBK16 TaxID=2699888 RepID=UPI001F34865E|nr:hypothetical protein [Tychonema sp. BBK16]MCF6374397.1 hypothetical protein [Tychonema sp. BBK16]